MAGCFQIVLADREGEVAEKAADVVRRRPRERFLVAAWRHLLRDYPHDLLEALLRALVDTLGSETVRRAWPESAWAVAWFEHPRLAQGALATYEAHPRREPFDAYLGRAGVSAEEGGGLWREAWRLLLAHGTRGALVAQPSGVLEDRLIRGGWGLEDRVRFGRHYLVTIPGPGEWVEPILEWVLASFGEPATPDSRLRHQDPFWEPLPATVKEAFRRWLLTREVVRFFEGERAEFWKHYVQEGNVRDVRLILDGQGFMLDFGGFGVIEFKQIGNAAYLYPREVFRAYWAEADRLTRPEAFKDRRRTLKGHWGYRGGDGRIIHSGDWRPWARYLIDHLIGRIT